MRPTQQARKALTAPDVIYNLAYWETVKKQIQSDLFKMIEEKAKASEKPPRADLLQMKPEEARKVMYWANKNLLEANTLYAVNEFMDSIMDACYISVIALNKEYGRKLDRVANEANYWRENFEILMNSPMDDIALRAHEHIQKLTEKLNAK